MALIPATLTKIAKQIKQVMEMGVVWPLLLAAVTSGGGLRLREGHGPGHR